MNACATLLYQRTYAVYSLQSKVKITHFLFELIKYWLIVRVQIQIEKLLYVCRRRWQPFFIMVHVFICSSTVLDSATVSIGMLKELSNQI